MRNGASGNVNILMGTGDMVVPKPTDPLIISAIKSMIVCINDVKRHAIQTDRGRNDSTFGQSLVSEDSTSMKGALPHASENSATTDVSFAEVDHMCPVQVEQGSSQIKNAAMGLLDASDVMRVKNFAKVIPFLPTSDLVLSASTSV